MLLAVYVAPAATVIFDFDTSSPPPPAMNTTTPFNYTSDGLLASFTAPTVGQSFSVQDVNSVQGASTLLGFFGKFLNPNSTAKASLDINFSQVLTNISLSFATTQSTAAEAPNPITITAYLNSTANPVGTPLTVSGSWDPLNTGTSQAMPSGTLTLSTASPFNLIQIQVGAGGAGGVMVDNISVATVPEPSVLALFCLGIGVVGMRAFRRRLTAN